MKIDYLPRALKALEDAPADVRKAFFKQVEFLAQDLRHPSLRAKKYDEAKDRWQARVNKDWRFYFNIVEDTYVIRDIIPHPK
jgi:mRNA-degrading endonuclease RelE of RelBE toxin-antitoxin system